MSNILKNRTLEAAFLSESCVANTMILQGYISTFSSSFFFPQFPKNIFVIHDTRPLLPEPITDPQQLDLRRCGFLSLWFQGVDILWTCFCDLSHQDSLATGYLSHFPVVRHKPNEAAGGKKKSLVALVGLFSLHAVITLIKSRK